jgi:hypothetical protein
LMLKGHSSQITTDTKRRESRWLIGLWSESVVA